MPGNNVVNEDIIERYLKLTRNAKEFLEREFGADTLHGYFMAVSKEKHIIQGMFESACNYVASCDIEELPLYINHCSPKIREIVERRLTNG